MLFCAARKLRQRPRIYQLLERCEVDPALHAHAITLSTQVDIRDYRCPLRVRRKRSRRPLDWTGCSLPSWTRALTRDPGQDGARVGDDRPVRQLERWQLGVSGRLAQLVPRALAEERDRMAVGGDHLLVLDSRGTECLLHPATRMPPRPSVIAVAHIQRRRFGQHGRPPAARGLAIDRRETARSNRLPATAPAPQDRRTGKNSSPARFLEQATRARRRHSRWWLNAAAGVRLVRCVPRCRSS